MKSIFCFLVLILTASFARAELGETIEQYTARYGDPVERKPASNVDEMVFFKKEGIKIGVGLKDGKCVLLILGNESGDRLSDEQVASLLKENAGGSLWKKSIKPSGMWSGCDRIISRPRSSVR